jgi:hypothetical protein
MSEHLFLGAGFLAHRPGAAPRDRMEGAPPGAAPPKELLPVGGLFLPVGGLRTLNFAQKIFW